MPTAIPLNKRAQDGGRPPGSLRPGRTLLAAVVLTALTVLAHAPFFDGNFGLDSDAWGNIKIGIQISASGVYRMSRPPGFPLIELLYAHAWPLGPYVLCAMTLGAAVLCTVLLYVILRRLAVGGAFGYALAFAFVPVVFINSTTTMDYLWGLLFILGALTALLRAQWLLTGVLTGLAVGCRLTNGLLIAPMAVMVWSQSPPVLRKKSLTELLLPFAVVSVVVFLPVLKYGGLDFLRMSPQPLTWTARLRTALYNGTVGVWGLLGSVAILIALMSILFGRRHRWAAGSLPHRMAGFSVLTVALYTVLFLIMPMEPGYMIVTVPFVIILLGLLLRPPP